MKPVDPPVGELAASLAPRRQRLHAAVHWMRDHAGRLTVVLALLAAIGVAAPRWWFGPVVPAAIVVQRDFTQSVVATGRVETPHRVDVGVQLTGTVAQVPVEEGQAVAAGQPLIRLEASELRAALAQAELAVRQAQARLRQLREVDEPGAEQALRQAEATHEVARRTLARQRELFAQGYIGQAALDDSIRAERIALAQLRTAQQQLESQREGGANALAAQVALAQALAGADAARARLSYTTVTAPLAGTLISRDVEPGDVVQPGKALMVLSPSGATQLVAQIDEKNVKLLALGQEALASADAYPDERFAARLAYINPGVDAQRGAVEVKLAVPEAPAYLRQDMTVSIDIEVARRPQAMLVPADAVHEPESRTPWVLKVQGGRAHRQAVALGLRGGGWVEVTQGLAAGDEVLAATGAAAKVQDGERVRVAARAKP